MDRFSLIVLTTSMSDHDWPDSIDRETGVFTYYGDNKVAGQKLHATPRRGNELLTRVFADSHSGPEGRRRVPPILVFSTAHGFRDVQFLGLVAPGTPGLTKTEDLVAVWHDGGAGRYQNYRARFSVLNAAVLSRAWLTDIIEDRDPFANAPPAWKLWVATGQYATLKSDRSRPWRNKNEQLPASDDEGPYLLPFTVTFPAGHMLLNIVRRGLPNYCFRMPTILMSRGRRVTAAVMRLAN